MWHSYGSVEDRISIFYELQDLSILYAKDRDNFMRMDIVIRGLCKLWEEIRIWEHENWGLRFMSIEAADSRFDI